MSVIKSNLEDILQKSHFDPYNKTGVINVYLRKK